MSKRKPPVDVDAVVGKFFAACAVAAVAVVFVLGVFQGWWF